MRNSNTIEGTTIQDKCGLFVTGIQLERHLNINENSKHFHFFSILHFSGALTKKEKKKKEKKFAQIN